MGYQSSEEQKDTNPDISEGYEKGYHRALARGKNVGKDSGYYDENGKGCQRVGRRNVDILEASFAVEERGKTPVTYAPKNYGKRN